MSFESLQHWRKHVLFHLNDASGSAARPFYLATILIVVKTFGHDLKEQ